MCPVLFFAQNGEMGALPTLRAAIDGMAKGGDYFGPDGFQEIKEHPVKVPSNTRSHNTENARKLWDISEQQTGVTFEFPGYKAPIFVPYGAPRNISY